MIELLLENNALNINAVDSDGHTALDAVATAVEGKLISFSKVNQTVTFWDCFLVPKFEIEDPKISVQIPGNTEFPIFEYKAHFSFFYMYMLWINTSTTSKGVKN